VSILSSPLRAVVAALFALIAFAPAAGFAPGGPPVPAAPAAAPVATIVEPVQSPIEALAEDAGEYARLYAVPIAEAYRRLAAQQESVTETDRLQRLYRDRLAGIVIEHIPEYRIVLLLTGNDPVPETRIRVGGTNIPVLFRSGAAATREQVVAAIKAHQAEIRAALPRPPAMGADPRTGELVVMTYGGMPDDADALTARFAALTGVPVRIVSLAQPTKNLAAEGGGRLEGVTDGRRYACTSGFVVTDGSRRGIVTAAHCPDSLAYVGPHRQQIPLEFVGQWGWGFQDVQVHVGAPDLEPLFFADTAKSLVRPVTASRSRASTRAGDFVCHRGESTGYSCAEIGMTDFAPAGDLCGGACLPTWVTVSGPTCKGGDSGSPVFAGTVALGIVKGGSYRSDGSCIFYFYMSTDYLPEGWSLLNHVTIADGRKRPSTAAGAGTKGLPARSSSAGPPGGSPMTGKDR
jgi:streptogrisin C